MKRAPLIPWLLVAGLAVAAVPASARITKTRSSASSTAAAGETPSFWAPLAAFVVGAGVEYQTDREQTEYAFPFLLEYNATERLRLILEPEYASIDSKSPDVRSLSGFGDLEAAVDYEFLSERRYRPALSVEGRIKWPTASDPDLGEPGCDYSLGLIASKDLVFVDLDLNVLYTFTGDREQEDTIEVSLAAEWHVNRYVDVIAEVASVTRTGGHQDGASGGRSDTEATLGLGWRVTRNLVFEQGVVFKEGGSWALVVAWEWNFGGD